MPTRAARNANVVQLAAILRAEIESGEITSRLHGERALQQDFGLAPVTICKAVRLLREEGLVRGQLLGDPARRKSAVTQVLAGIA